MILRTDTIGHIENPMENDIVRAFFPTKGNKRPNDIIKLQIDEGNYLCVWLGYSQNDNTLIYCKDYKQKRCSSKFECEQLIKLFIQYLNGRVD